MIIKVDKEGFLQIMTRGKMKNKLCPYKDSRCGDWCALFEQCDDPPRVFLNCSRLEYDVDEEE